MHFLTAILALVATTAALPTETQPTEINLLPSGGKTLGTLDGTPIVPVYWTGQFSADGPNIKITGASFDQIFSYVDAHIELAFKAATIANRTDTPTPVRVMGELNCILSEPYFLNKAWKGARDHLRRATGMCGLGATNRRQCGRVSCSWDSGVFLCNQDRGGAVPCNELGDMVELIEARCPKGPTGFRATFEFVGNPLWSEIRGVFMNGEAQEGHC